MKSPTARRVILVAFLFFVCIAMLTFLDHPKAVSPVNSSTSGKAGVSGGAMPSDEGNSNEVSVVRPKRPRIEQEGAPDLKDVEASLRNQLEADGPEVASSVVHALIPEGKSMVTGGYVTADGSFEFSVVTPQWINNPGGGKAVEMNVKILKVNEEGLARTGLKSLVVPGRKTVQNAEVWSPEDVAKNLDEPVDGVGLTSTPRAIAMPGSPAEISTGSTDAVEGFFYSLVIEAKEAAGGGFELTSDIKHVR